MASTRNVGDIVQDYFGSLHGDGSWDEPLVNPQNVFDRWWSELRVCEPWSGMAIDDAGGYMRPILSELLNEACDPGSMRDAGRLAKTAWTHGRFRRSLALSGAHVELEIRALREAIATELATVFQSEGLFRASMIVVDHDISLVARGVVAGWRGSDCESIIAAERV